MEKDKISEAYLSMKNLLILTSTFDQSFYIQFVERLEQLSSLISQDYESDRFSVQPLIGLFDKYSNLVIPAMLQYVDITRDDAVKAHSIVDFCKDTMSLGQDEMLRLFGLQEPLIEKYGSNIELIDASIEVVDGIIPEDRKKFVSAVTQYIQHQAQYTTWKPAEIENVVVLLFFVRCIALKDDSLQTFYFNLMMFCDRLTQSGYLQTARDFAEEIIMVGHKDDMLGYAYLCASRIYTLCNNVIGGLLFLSLHIYSLKKLSCKEINCRLIWESYWQSVKCLRISGFRCDNALKRWMNNQDTLNVSDYEKVAFAHSCFTLRLSHHDKDICADISSYIDEHRTKIIKQGWHGAMPWYITILNLIDIYPESTANLPLYERLFDMIIEDKSSIALQVDILKRQNMKEHLIEELIKIDATRSHDDFTKDSNIAQTIARKLLSVCHTNHNHEGFLLSMLLRSDFSFVFHDIDSLKMAQPMKMPEVNSEDIETIFDDLDQFCHYLSLDPQDEFIWLGVCDRWQLHEMSLWKNTFSIATLSTASIHALSESITQGLFRLSFDTIKNGYPKDKNDYIEESNTLKKELDSYKISIDSDTLRLIIVKDMEISSYPHNLFIDNESGCFVGELKPLANVLSSEFMLRNFMLDVELSKNYSRGFWCPIDCEDGRSDITLNMLFEHLQYALNGERISIDKNYLPPAPLSHDLNIICAHGGSNIKDEQCFYVNNNPIREIDRIVGSGKMLIMLICHSGSMDSSRYDNSIHSLIKKYIRMGYSSVIAPMWALPIDILPIWFAEFFVKFNAGSLIIDAVFAANMKVRETYPTPAAWACLHLFGNPYLNVKY